MRQLLAILCCLLVASPGWAAFNAATEWDVRTTGNDANGGGFWVGSTGTDRSQQDGAYQAYTDIVIGATTTQGTSVLHPFDATTVGNIINITGGAGCTVQRVQAVSQAAGVVTFDKALGTAASACAGNLGGGLATLAVSAGLFVAGNTVHLKTGTYTLTSTVTFNPTGGFTIIGYNATHNDGGTKPLITTATNSTNLLTLLHSNALVKNISFSSTASVKYAAIARDSGSGAFALLVEDCLFNGLFQAVFSNQLWNPIYIVNSEIENCTGNATEASGPIYLVGSYIHNCVAGIKQTSTDEDQGIVDVERCILVGNTTAITGASKCRVFVRNSVIANNTASGITLTTPHVLSIVNSIIYGHAAGYGINCSAAPDRFAYQRNVALGANNSGNRLNLSAGIGDVTLTADPFTGSAGGDYSLNSAAGGGALCKATGFPGVFPGGTTTGYLDIGAAQSAAGGGAATMHGSAFVQ